METTEIKRYLPTIDYRYNGTTETVTAVMDEHSQGEWVRWEDVEQIVEMASDAVRQCIVQTGRPPDRQPRARIDD